MSNSLFGCNNKECLQRKYCTCTSNTQPILSADFQAALNACSSLNLNPDIVALLKGEKGDTGIRGMAGPVGPTGPQGLQGEQGPIGPSGGPVGPAGANGTNGTNGKTVLNGSGAPSNGLGTDGDFYINTATSQLYGPKTAGVWGSSVSLIGPAGATGLTGATGPAGATGATGATGAVGPAASLDGWMAVAPTWTYLFPTEVTVPTDATTIFAVGDKVRFRQGAGYKYFYVVGVTSTVLTLFAGFDYAVANAPITDIYISKAVNPLLFPSAFNTLVLWEQGPLIGYTNNINTIHMEGRVVTQRWYLEANTNGTAPNQMGLSTGLSPVLFPRIFWVQGNAHLYDSSAGIQYLLGAVIDNATELRFISDDSGGNYFGSLPSLAVGSGDIFSGLVRYEI